jgi:hypothetical protein
LQHNNFGDARGETHITEIDLDPPRPLSIAARQVFDRHAKRIHGEGVGVRHAVWEPTAAVPIQGGRVPIFVTWNWQICHKDEKLTSAATCLELREPQSTMTRSARP